VVADVVVDATVVEVVVGTAAANWTLGPAVEGAVAVAKLVAKTTPAARSTPARIPTANLADLIMIH
jgi:hypothetical protein